MHHGENGKSNSGLNNERNYWIIPWSWMNQIPVLKTEQFTTKTDHTIVNWNNLWINAAKMFDKRIIIKKNRGSKENGTDWWVTILKQT